MSRKSHLSQPVIVTRSDNALDSRLNRLIYSSVSCTMKNKSEHLQLISPLRLAQIPSTEYLYSQCLAREFRILLIWRHILFSNTL